MIEVPFGILGTPFEGLFLNRVAPQLLARKLSGNTLESMRDAAHTGANVMFWLGGITAEARSSIKPVDYITASATLLILFYGILASAAEFNLTIAAQLQNISE